MPIINNSISWFLTRLFCIVLFSLLLNGCAYPAPKEMPTDFTIRYEFSGGMSTTYKSIELKIGECRFESKLNYDEIPLTYTFQLKKEDLALLYKDLRSIHAFTLRSKTTKVYDRGGESIGYMIDGKFYHVSNSGMSFIINAHQKAFSKSVLLITSLADKYHP